MGVIGTGLVACLSVLHHLVLEGGFCRQPALLLLGQLGRHLIQLLLQSLQSLSAVQAQCHRFVSPNSTAFESCKGIFLPSDWTGGHDAITQQWRHSGISASSDLAQSVKAQ